MIFGCRIDRWGGAGESVLRWELGQARKVKNGPSSECGPVYLVRSRRNYVIHRWTDKLPLERQRWKVAVGRRQPGAPPPPICRALGGRHPPCRECTPRSGATPTPKPETTLVPRGNVQPRPCFGAAGQTVICYTEHPRENPLYCREPLRYRACRVVVPVVDSPDTRPCFRVPAMRREEDSSRFASNAGKDAPQLHPCLPLSLVSAAVLRSPMGLELGHMDASRPFFKRKPIADMLQCNGDRRCSGDWFHPSRAAAILPAFLVRH